MILLLALLGCMISISNAILVANTTKQIEGTLKFRTFLFLLKSNNLALGSIVLFRH